MSRMSEPVTYVGWIAYMRDSTASVIFSARSGGRPPSRESDCVMRCAWNSSIESFELRTYSLLLSTIDRSSICLARLRTSLPRLVSE